MENNKQASSPDDASHSASRIGKRAFASSFLILLALVVFAGVLTRVLPTGRMADQGGAPVFEPTSSERLPAWRWFTASVEVLWSEDGPAVIVLVLLLLFVGGAFAILERSRVLEYWISLVVSRFERRRRLLLASMTLTFMLFGSMLGILEEVIPLVPIAVALCFAMGWDSLTALGTTVLAAGFGFAAAVANPFTVGLAQRLAGLPAFSGSWYRVLVFACTYGVLTLFLLRHARRIEADPASSLVFEQDRKRRELHCRSSHGFGKDERALRRSLRWFGACLAGMGAAIAVGAALPSLSGFALPTVGLMYLAAGFGCGLLCGFSARETARSFARGMAGIAPSLVLILMGVSVKHILSEGQVLDALLYEASRTLTGASPYAAALAIYSMVLGANFFIGSASAKAFLLIPLLVPFAEMVGLTRQVAITAWCFGDGFSNMIYPTNAVLLLSLGLTGIGYPTWFRWTFKLQASMVALNLIFLLFAVFIGYGP